MTTTAKVLIGVGSLIVIGVGSYIGYNYYEKKKNTSTKEQFDDLIAAFTKSGADVFQGVTPELYKKSLANFIKNISKQEADKLIVIAGKKEKDLSVSEKLELVSDLQKILGKSAKS